MKKGVIIGIVNEKGGVAKTTTNQNLIYYFAREGLKVLAVEGDKQGDLTAWLEAESEINFGDVLLGNANIKDAIVQTNRENVDCIVADPDLADKEEKLKQFEGKEQIMRISNALDEIKHEYDVIFIDSSPYFNKITGNIIVACHDLVIVPMKMDKKTIRGGINTINNIRDLQNVGLVHNDYRILVAMKSRNNITRDAINDLRELFPGKMFETEIRFQEKPVSESDAECKAIYEKFPKERVAKEYMKLGKEIEELLQIGKE